jgi:hypothetical protein
MLGVVPAGFVCVMLGVGVVPVRDVRMVAGFFMIAGAMMLGGGAMMFGGVLVMLGGFQMMFRGVFGHGITSAGDDTRRV